MADGDIIPVVPESAVSMPSRPRQVADRLQEVKQEISVRFIEMGQLLLEAQRNNYHQTLGYESFELFVEEQLDLSYRTARYLADTFKVFIEEMHVPQEQLADLGWTRAAKLLPLADKQDPATGQKFMTEQNAGDWINHAQTKTVAALDLEVRETLAPPGHQGKLRKYDPLTIGCFEEEKEILEHAIALAKLEAGTDRPATALLLICQGYIAEAEARQAEAQRSAS